MRKISSRVIVKKAILLDKALKTLEVAEEAFRTAERATEAAWTAGSGVSEAQNAFRAAEDALSLAKANVKKETEAAAKVAENMRGANGAAPVVPDSVPPIVPDSVPPIVPDSVPPIVPDSVPPIVPGTITTVIPELTEGAGEAIRSADNLPAIAKEEKTTSIASRVGKWYGGITGPQKVILVGAILGETIYQLTPEQAAERIDAELSSYEQILAPIYENDVVDWVIGGDLDVITDADKQIILRKVTKAVLTNDISTLSPEGIAGLIANSSSAKAEVGRFQNPGEGVTGIFTEKPFVNMQTLKADSGAWSAIQNASDILTEKAAKIAESAAAEAARPAPVTPAPVAPTPAPTEPPPISARPAETGATTTPISSGIPEMSNTLVELGYLKTPQTSWTPELDTAFRAFMDKGTSLTKDMYHTNLASGKESWSEVASLVGFQPNIGGAAKAVKTLSDSLGPSVASSGATSSDTAAAAGGTDTLPKIVSAMYTGNLTKLLGPDFTRGIDLVNEERRMRILVGALGGASKEGYENASKVILQQDPGLSADLPKIINGAITKDYVKQNMDLFKRIQTALNTITYGAFGLLAPTNMNNAISKMRSWLQTKEGGGRTIQSVTSSQNSQWVKLANERKMKLRLQIAAEMTPAERAAARRIKMREAV
jgi:hypothetical protein